jgi:predicted nucleic acid-binding protein
VIVLDTSVVLALLNGRDRNHDIAREWVISDGQGLATTPLAVAEMDHLVRRHAGVPGADALWAELEAGAYGVRWWPAAMLDSLEIARRWREIDLGLTDASLVALAGRLGTAEIATFDQRHFRAVTPESVGSSPPVAPAFRLLPLDSA